MDPELKRLLEETKALVKDNHDMLRSMRRERWLGVIWKIVFWAIILLAPLYFFAPYLSALPSATEFQTLINQYHLSQ